MSPEEMSQIEQEKTNTGKPGGPGSPVHSVDALLPRPKPPQEGSKREVILALLRRQDGASIAEMMVVTGWLPHTTRAALTGYISCVLVQGRATEAGTVKRVSAHEIEAFVTESLRQKLGSALDDRA